MKSKNKKGFVKHFKKLSKSDKIVFVCAVGMIWTISFIFGCIIGNLLLILYG